jgi:histidyl-tRNA synthetase
MSKQKPSLARGTRDFGPDKMAKRQYIFNTIRAVFEKFGFQPLETPAIENLSVLMGKYGDEGDQLLFKILNSGNFSEKISQAHLDQGYKALTTQISEKGLRYDLTVPFARYVSMNRGELTFPFKRYQIQPVWRADRPQRGRYREFYQCDADVVGTNSLLCEVEILAMLQDVFGQFGLPVTIKINNRKILTGIAEAIGAIGHESTLAVAIDKLDKIGQSAVNEELIAKGFAPQSIEKLAPIFSFSGSNEQKLEFLTGFLANTATGLKGITEVQQILESAKQYGLTLTNIELDITLARGLSYYTGAIFEVKANNVTMGSISGGGRYDGLTDLFGLPDVSGVGISFGVDRIYDVLDELQLYPNSSQNSTKLLVSNFDAEVLPFALKVLNTLRANNIKAEIYPDTSKLKKQMEYANKRGIAYMAVIGSDEATQQSVTLKNMAEGSQQLLSIAELLLHLQAN